MLYFVDSLSEVPNKSGGPNKRRVGTFFIYVDEKRGVGTFFTSVGEKTWRWAKFLKKNKMCSTLIREVKLF